MSLSQVPHKFHEIMHRKRNRSSEAKFSKCCGNNQLEMVAGTVRYSTMIPVPVATLYPLKYRRRYFWELELDPGAGAVDTAY